MVWLAGVRRAGKTCLCQSLDDIEYFWRNKRGAEVDFVLPLRGGHEPIALECKWQAASFDPSALLAFRRGYPRGENYVVAPDVERAYTRTYTGTRVRFVSLDHLTTRLTRAALA